MATFMEGVYRFVFTMDTDMPPDVRVKWACANPPVWSGGIVGLGRS